MISARALKFAWLVTIVGGAMLGYGLWARRHAEAIAYLAAFGALFSTVLGALALLAMMRTLHARWFVALRGLAVALCSTTLLLPVLFLPIALALAELFPWAAAPRANAELWHTRRAQLWGHDWLGSGWFWLRSAVYLALWVALAAYLRRAERARAEPRPERRARVTAISAVALPMLGFSGSWAGFDWLMSALPGCNLTSFGLYLLTGGFCAALGSFALLVFGAKQRNVLPAEVGEAHALALGRLLLSSVCLWAYIAVSQLIIVWIADIPREAAFYLPRARGSFRAIAGLLVAGHFIVPFFLLLSRSWKQRFGFLAWLGGWLVLMHALDLYWLVVPSSSPAASWLDAGPFLFMAGLSTLFSHARFSRANAVPARDPELARSLAYESP
jgi:hypothetical protein